MGITALISHDAELAGAGITTVFDALRVGSSHRAGDHYEPYARKLATELLELRGRGALRISHYLHLRAEICSETLIEELESFDAGDRVGIVSLMDHTPGQRQFSDITQYRTYIMGKSGMNEAELRPMLPRASPSASASAPSITASALARPGGWARSSPVTTTPWPTMSPTRVPRAWRSPSSRPRSRPPRRAAPRRWRS